MMDGSACEHAADRHSISTDLTVAQNNHRELVVDRLFGFFANEFECLLDASFS